MNPPSACHFCAIAAGDPGADAHVVYSDPDVVAFLDHRPVFKGHTLVIPRRHVVTLPELPDSLLTPVFTVARRVATAMGDRKDGLRGFFWPRQKYEPGEAARVAARVRAAIDAVG